MGLEEGPTSGDRKARGWAHELPSIFRVSDRVIMLSAEKKGVVDDGSPAYLRDHSADDYVRTFLSRGGTYKSNSTEPDHA